jgi:predicted DNA repair protein MutK
MARANEGFIFEFADFMLRYGVCQPVYACDFFCSREIYKKVLNTLVNLDFICMSVLGTAAMFLVGGGILLHGIPALGHAVEHWFFGMGWMRDLFSNLAGGVVGLVAGAAAAGAWQLVRRLKK